MGESQGLIKTDTQEPDAGLPGMMQAEIPCGRPSGSDLIKNLKVGPLILRIFWQPNLVILFDYRRLSDCRS